MRTAILNDPKRVRMNDALERFFVPLVDGYLQRYGYKFQALIKDPEKLECAKQKALIQCWAKFDLYKPDTSASSMSYFTTLISRVFLHDSIKETEHNGRFINASEFEDLD